MSEHRLHVAVRAGRTIQLVAVESIDWIKARGHYVRLHCAADVHFVRTSLGEMLNRVNGEVFIQVNRSAIVRIEAITDIVVDGPSNVNVRLATGERIRFGRQYLDEFKRRFL